ncbi:MAG: hypothetical protein OEU32_14825 [Acidimicrobiia bacterium]|nr:hypothetical protein [Acidimicrobiia bacterium]
MEIDAHEDLTVFASLGGKFDGVLGPDVEHAAEAIEPGWSILMILWEDRWAQSFAEAIRGSGGVRRRVRRAERQDPRRHLMKEFDRATAGVVVPGPMTGVGSGISSRTDDAAPFFRP